jgi:hypothetical protein
MSSQKSEKKNTSKTVVSTKIKEVLNQERFQKLQGTNTVVRFDLVKTLIEGTEDEYYNKLKVRDTLEKAMVANLVEVLSNDATYNWNTLAVQDISFDPQQQFLLKSPEGQLTLLLDENKNVLAFMDLYGRQLIGVADEFPFFLKNITIKE